MKVIKKKIEESGKKHMENVFLRLKPYENMNLLERYAIFFGKVQIVELLLKQSLASDRGYDFDKLEKMPLGGLIGLLKKEKANNLFLFLLDDLNSFRKPLAHEFLVNQVIMASLLKTKIKKYTKPIRQLEKALFSVEQFLLNYESVPAGYIWFNK